jgi:DNA-binding NtrC family response regulator
VDSPWKVLIVSADAECCSQIAESLTLWKMEPILATDYARGKDILEKEPVALAFCDSRLPDDGFRQMLSLTSTQKRPVPLVALVCDEKGYQDATALGAFDAIPLPCERSDVRWIVIRTMREQQSHRRDSTPHTASSHAGNSNSPDDPNEDDTRESDRFSTG